jgi:hypothetical protein
MRFLRIPDVTLWLELIKFRYHVTFVSVLWCSSTGRHERNEQTERERPDSAFLRSFREDPGCQGDGKEARQIERRIACHPVPPGGGQGERRIFRPRIATKGARRGELLQRIGSKKHPEEQRLSCDKTQPSSAPTHGPRAQLPSGSAKQNGCPQLRQTYSEYPARDAT